ncbi:DUF397 domain-containing protein [Actinomadura madurae]|uniref:DUF397 domain-containing protein n=1 Tax=Actinomadura madurae TaxID=1993 RepID=UPI000D89E543|nr:DUF397 domain-containing protein [Actinomadura madurae]SPT58758.1 Domain of uncharacterised function (DUF397) [Actinomadura madurae]
MSHSDQLVLSWRKSSHSDATGGECVEIAAASEGLLFRDSKDPDGPQLALTRMAVRDLVRRLRGE